MGNYVENEHRIYHIVAHTHYGRPINSLRFTTVPIAFIIIDWLTHNKNHERKAFEKDMAMSCCKD